MPQETVHVPGFASAWIHIACYSTVYLQAILSSLKVLNPRWYYGLRRSDCLGAEINSLKVLNLTGFLI